MRKSGVFHWNMNAENKILLTMAKLSHPETENPNTGSTLALYFAGFLGFSSFRFSTKQTTSDRDNQQLTRRNQKILMRSVCMQIRHRCMIYVCKIVLSCSRDDCNERNSEEIYSDDQLCTNS